MQVTPPDSDFPLRVGLSGEYEFAAASDAADRAELRVVVEREIGHSRIACNLIGEHEFSGESAIGYAAGYRYEITEKVACGFEAQGEFSDDARHECVVGIYGEPNEGITPKRQALARQSARHDVGPTFRAGIVYRF